MLTVSILINGQPLFTRSCFREEVGKYRVDDGSIIEHNYNDGAIKLAHKLLDTMYELERKQKQQRLDDLIKLSQKIALYENQTSQNAR